MTQPIDRETVIALADLWDSQWPTYPRTPEGIGGMVAVKLCAKELREAVANSRKDAEPVFCKGLPKLPKPSGYRHMVPAYTDEEMYRYGESCIAKHSQEADKPNPLDDLDCAKMMVRSSGYSLVSADFINSFAEFIQDWRKGDFDLPRLAALDVEACFYAWQAGVNQAEVNPTKEPKPNPDGTDYVSDREFDALISELQIITEEARATDYHDTLRKAALFLNLLKSKVHEYAKDIVRLDAACAEQHAAYTSAHNRLNEADKLLQQALEALEYRLQQTRPIHQADVVMEAIRTYLEGKK